MATRSGEAFNQAGRNWIASSRNDGRDFIRRYLGRERGGISECHNDINICCLEFGYQTTKPIDPPIGPSLFKHRVAPFNKSTLGKNRLEGFAALV